MSKSLILSLTVAAALTGAPYALAKDQPNQAFIKKAIEGNLSEVAVGQLAQLAGKVRAELDKVLELQPKDAVTSALIASLSERDAKPSKPPPDAPAPKVVKTDDVSGAWTAAATCSVSAWSSTSCSPASGPSRGAAGTS